MLTIKEHEVQQSETKQKLKPLKSNLNSKRILKSIETQTWPQQCSLNQLIWGDLGSSVVGGPIVEEGEGVTFNPYQNPWGPRAALKVLGQENVADTKHI